MDCPCRDCREKGCGAAHDSCVFYEIWREKCAAANARRAAEHDVKSAIIAARIRAKGKGK